MVSIAPSTRSSRSPARRKGQAERRVLALPPAGADADEGPAAGERVEGGRGLGGDARRAERHRRDQGAELETGVQAGQQPEGHPRLGDRLPRPADLRDLDQVVHQREPGEPRLVGREGDVRAATPPGPRPTGTGRPGARPPAPGSCADPGLTGSCASRRALARPQAHDPARARPWTTSQPSVSSSSATRPHPLELAGQRRGGDGPVARGVAAAALGVGGREDRDHGRQSGLARGGQPAVRRSASSPRVSTTVVRPRPSRAATIGLQQGERVGGGVEVVRPAADHAAQRVGGDDLLAAVARPRPRWTCPSRRRRPGRPGPGRAAARSLGRLAGWQLGAGHRLLRGLLHRLGGGSRGAWLLGDQLGHVGGRRLRLGLRLGRGLRCWLGPGRRRSLRRRNRRREPTAQEPTGSERRRSAGGKRRTRSRLRPPWWHQSWRPWLRVRRRSCRPRRRCGRRS